MQLSAPFSQLVFLVFHCGKSRAGAFIKRKQNKFYINICHITKANFNDFCRCKIIVREFFCRCHHTNRFFGKGRTRLAFNVLLAFNFTDCRPFYALATLLTFILRHSRSLRPPSSCGCPQSSVWLVAATPSAALRLFRKLS